MKQRARTDVSSRKDDLLLYSFKCFESIIGPFLESLAPDSVCEIGVEKGWFTSFLMDFCRKQDCVYTGIDPWIDGQEIQEGGKIIGRFIKGRSLDSLPGLPPQGAYFIDGDHNYYTVHNELKLILGQEGRSPVVFLHDVGWPWGRRDQYCNPEVIPKDYLHPHSKELGPVPGRQELQNWGFRGDRSDYTFAAAESEGGPRNGVLTAVEDWMGEPGVKGWDLLVVPAVFGLGILHHAESMPGPAVALLESVAENAKAMDGIVRGMEENRIELVLAFLESLSIRKDISISYNELVTEYRKLRKHSRDLRAWARDLRAWAKGLKERLDRTEKNRGKGA